VEALFSVFLEGSPVVMRSGSQKSVTLSVTEAELAAAVQTAQDMLFVMRILESVGLKVQKPMILMMDNSGAHDLTHNWSIGGRTRHVDVRMHFLRELKEDGIIVCDWVSGDNNPADLFTKNLQGPTFNKHASNFVGHDEYMTATLNDNNIKEAPKKPPWQLRKNGKTKARVRQVNYGENFK
jgi:hypothetical protein